MKPFVAAHASRRRQAHHSVTSVAAISGFDGSSATPVKSAVCATTGRPAPHTPPIAVIMLSVIEPVPHD